MVFRVLDKSSCQQDSSLMTSFLWKTVEVCLLHMHFRGFLCAPVVSSAGVLITLFPSLSSVRGGLSQLPGCIWSTNFTKSEISL